MNEEYERGFIDALEVVMEVAKKHKQNLAEKIGELWILAKDKRTDRILKELGFF